MNMELIKMYVDHDIKVYCGTKAYEVIKDNKGQYLIHCILNDSYIGLTEQDANDCFIVEE